MKETEVAKKLIRRYEPVRELVEELTGWVPSCSTVTKWKRDGLRTLRIGGRICVNREVMIEFLEASSEPKSGGQKERSESSINKAVSEADKQLAAEGV